MFSSLLVFLTLSESEHGCGHGVLQVGGGDTLEVPLGEVSPERQQ